MFKFRLSDNLQNKIKKLVKRDPKRIEILNKKIIEIINNDSTTIAHYKNLKYELKNLKRVHIDKHFVLVFDVNLKEKVILFLDFDHHDNVYKN